MLKVTHRVGDFAVYTNLEMQVGARAVARAAGVADDLALRTDWPAATANGSGGRNRWRARRRGRCRCSCRSRRFRPRTGEDDGAASGGADRRPFRHGDVDPRVVLVAGADVAAAEAARRSAPLDRPDHAAAAALDRARRQRRRAGFASCCGDLALDRGDVAVELLLVGADLRQRRFARAAGGDQLRLAALQRGRGCWPAPALRRRSQSRARSIRFFALRRRSTRSLTSLRRSRTRPTTASSMPCRRSRYSARAARSSTPSEPTMTLSRSGRAGLVDRDQALAQGDQGASAGGRAARTSRSLAPSSSATACQFGLLGGEAFVDRGLAGADRRHLGGQLVRSGRRSGRSSRSGRPSSRAPLRASLLRFQFSPRSAAGADGPASSSSASSAASGEREPPGLTRAVHGASVGEASQAPRPGLQTVRHTCNRACDTAL